MIGNVLNVIARLFTIGEELKAFPKTDYYFMRGLMSWKLDVVVNFKKCHKPFRYISLPGLLSDLTKGSGICVAESSVHSWQSCDIVSSFVLVLVYNILCNLLNTIRCKWGLNCEHSSMNSENSKSVHEWLSLTKQAVYFSKDLLFGTGYMLIL